VNPQAIVGTQTFTAIYDGYSGRIYRYLCSLVRDASLAEDLAQDTFVKAYKALSAGEQPDHISGWLYAIATNTALSALRRRKLIAWLQFGGSTTGELLAAEEGHEDRTGERDLIRRALRDLSGVDAACLLLRFEQGLSYEDIATVLGSSVPAAKMRVSRARAAFREAYLRRSQEV
jgi:RNA polymerase sigma-70 factor (ECF subfamily)